MQTLAKQCCCICRFGSSTSAVWQFSQQAKSLIISYLAKNETKEELKGKRLTQSKTPIAHKTKQAQKIRTIKIDLKD